jgi:hypothetical protein
MKCSHVIVTRDGTHIGKGNILLSYDLRIWVLQESNLVLEGDGH